VFGRIHSQTPLGVSHCAQHLGQIELPRLNSLFGSHQILDMPLGTFLHDLRQMAFSVPFSSIAALNNQSDSAHLKRTLLFHRTVWAWVL